MEEPCAPPSAHAGRACGVGFVTGVLGGPTAARAALRLGGPTWSWGSSRLRRHSCVSVKKGSESLELSRRRRTGALPSWRWWVRDAEARACLFSTLPSSRTMGEGVWREQKHRLPVLSPQLDHCPAKGAGRCLGPHHLLCPPAE